MALKGLTSKDREEWEVNYADELKGRTSTEIENAWRNFHFKKRFGDRDDFASLSKMSAQEKEDFYNADYDKSLQDNINKIDVSIEDLNKQQLQSTQLDSDATRIQEPLQPKQSIISDEEQEYYRKHSKAFENAMNKYNNLYERNYKAAKDGTKNIQDLANEISPYYRKYNNTDYLPFEDSDWTGISKEFYARLDVDGEEDAVEWLKKTIQNEVEENQSQVEKLWYGFKGMGADAVATTAGFIGGVAKGSWDYFSGNHKDIKGASFFTNYLDAIIDNDVTRWADDVIKWGSLFKATQERAKEIGLPENHIVQTYEQETQQAGMLELMFNRNVPATALKQYGFTFASLLEGAAANKLTGWAFKGIKANTIKKQMQLTGKTMMEVRNSLQNIRKVENAVNRYLIPGVVGTGEGMMEALQTKMDVLENGQQYIGEVQSKAVEDEFKKLVAQKYQQMFNAAMSQNIPISQGAEHIPGMATSMKPNPDVVSQAILEQLYKEAWDSFNSKYQDLKGQLEYNAARAGTTNFLWNSLINGGLNMTLQASLFNSNIQGQLRSTKLGKLLTPQGNIKVDKAGNVTTSFPWYQQAWNFVKEPLGEMMEEGAQVLTDAYSKGSAYNNLRHFADNKYHGDGTAKIGEWWIDDIGAGVIAAGREFTEKDIYLNMYYALITSTVGGVSKPERAQTKDGKTTLFGRGLNAAGEQESQLERIARIMPWRTGIGHAIRENKAFAKELQTDAETLQAWINNPANKAKFDGLVGTLNWAQEMQTNAENGDEFGYRNSALGKTINDILMLQKLEGTEYYDAFMEQLQEVANLEAGSEIAQSYIAKMRNSVSTKEAMAKMTDEEILDQLKTNANKMLQTQFDIVTISEKLEGLLGNLDIDTKESLIYGEMQIKDWQEREATLKSELEKIKVNDTVSRSNLSEEAKLFISQFGSISKAFAKRDEIIKQNVELSTDIARLKARKRKLSDAEKQVLVTKQLKLAANKKILDSFKAIENIEEQSVILSESEIMELDSIVRANLLNPNNQGKYSEQQMAVINNLINNGTATDAQFLNKIRDAARIQSGIKRYINDYNAILTDPQSFNIYVYRAKQEAKKEAYKRRYDSLKSIKDYTEFAQAMDKLFVDGSPQERQTIFRQFDKDEAEANAQGAQTNYGRYSEQRRKVADILNHASKGSVFSQLSGNDIDMFTHAVTYLTEKNIDVSNIDEVTNALTETDAQGKNIFQQYVDDINVNADEGLKTQFTSPGEVIQTIKDVMAAYTKDKQEQALNNAPIIISDSDQDNSPAAAPAPGAFATAATTLEEANNDLRQEIKAGTIAPNTTITETGQTVAKPEQTAPIVRTELSERIQLFADNSSEEVIAAARNLEFLIENAKNISEEAKTIALNALEELGNNPYNTVEEIVNAVIAEANRLDANQEQGEDSVQAASKLREASQKVLANAKNTRLKLQREAERRATEEKTRMQDATSKSPLLARALNIAQSRINLESNNIATVSISWMKQNLSIDPNNPKYSPLFKYVVDNHIEEFLQKGTIDKNTPVFFITDPALREAQRQDYEKKGFMFNESNYPLIAVVESKDGPVRIGDKQYQPIGVMPRTGGSTSGSNRLKLVRTNISENAAGPYLIEDANGVIETRLSGYVRANAPQQVYDNISVLESGMNDLTQDEKDEFSGVSKINRKTNHLYQKLKKAFFAKVKVLNKPTRLVLNTPTLKKGIIPIQVFVTDVSRTVDTNSDSTIVELLNSNNLSVLRANSRIRRYVNELSDRIKELGKIPLMTTPDGKLKEESLKAINDFAETLTKELKNFMYPAGYEYRISVGNIVDGVRQYTLEITNDEQVIKLGDFTIGELTDEKKLEILKNLIMDGNQVRTQDGGIPNGKNALVKWQVNYHDFVSDSQEAKNNASDLYDDGILEVSKDGLNYRINELTLEAPYTTEGVKRTFPLQVANADNASTNNSDIVENQVIAADGTIIDSDTGTSIIGNTKTPTQTEAQRVASQTAEIILEEAKMFDAGVDSFFDNSSDTEYQAFPEETLLADIEKVGQTQVPNYVTAINRVLNNMFTELLLGREISEHPNMTDKAFENFKAQINAFKNGLHVNGITLVPQTIVGKFPLEQYKIAQGMFLGYDTDGNWHIYAPTMQFFEKKDQQRFAEHLNVFANDIAKRMKINIKDITVVPIKAEYPKSQVTSIADNGQVTINKKRKYSGARPTMSKPFTTTSKKEESAATMMREMEVVKVLTATEQEQESTIPVLEEPELLDPNTGMDFEGDTDVTLGLFDDDLTSNDGLSNEPELNYVPASQTWGVFEGRGLNVEATMKNLEATGYTQERWNSLTDAEREKELKCKGVQ